MTPKQKAERIFADYLCFMPMHTMQKQTAWQYTCLCINEVIRSSPENLPYWKQVYREAEKLDYYNL